MPFPAGQTPMKNINSRLRLILSLLVQRNKIFLWKIRKSKFKVWLRNNENGLFPRCDTTPDFSVKEVEYFDFKTFTEPSGRLKKNWIFREQQYRRRHKKLTLYIKYNCKYDNIQFSPPCITKFTKNPPTCFPAILVSIVVSIPACHAGDRGSIPRRGDVLLNYKCFDKYLILTKVFDIFSGEMWDLTCFYFYCTRSSKLAQPGGYIEGKLNFFSE